VLTGILRDGAGERVAGARVAGRPPDAVPHPVSVMTARKVIAERGLIFAREGKRRTPLRRSVPRLGPPHHGTQSV
jgi:hypothetical protein